MTTQSITSFMGLIVPFSKKKYRYLQSRESFYEGRNFLSSYSRLSSIVKYTSTNDLDTKKSIKFYGLDFGISMKKAIGHLGKPNYVSKHSTLLRKHKAIYYRINIAQVKCILQLHFLNDQFFLGLIEIRSSDEQVKNEVTSLISRKYGMEDGRWNGSIKDASDNRIELKDDIVPYIVYLSGDEQIRESIQLQMAQQSKKKLKYYEKRSDLLLEMI